MAGEAIPVEVAGRVLDVSVSGYYAWRDRPLLRRAIRHARLTDLFIARGLYGRAASGEATRSGVKA